MKHGKRVVVYISIALLAAAIIAVGIYSVNLRKEKKRTQWIEAPEIHQGISAGGIELGGLTVAQATQVLQEQQVKLLANLEITLQLGGQQRQVTAQQAGIQIDAEKTARSAHALGREGDYGQLSQEITRLKEGMEVPLCYMVREQAALELATMLESEYGTQPKSAWIEAKNGQIVYHEEQPGLSVQGEALYNVLYDAAQKGKFTAIEVPLQQIQPEVVLTDFTEGMILRASAVTYFDGTGDNRGSNIKKAVEMLDNTFLHSGESFSMNAVLGDRTEQNGWKQAPAIVDGGARREDQPGGGVCQVSSTLYNAVAKADLKVTYRRNHSAQVGYVKPGLDATINTGTIDFTWENDTTGDIYIHAWIANDKELHVEVYGLPFEGFDEIKLESEYTGAIQPTGEMEVVYDAQKPQGYEEIEVQRSEGATYTSYKLYYADGQMVKKEKLANSKYRAQNGVKVIGTGQ